MQLRLEHSPLECVCLERLRQALKINPPLQVPAITTKVTTQRHTALVLTALTTMDRMVQITTDRDMALTIRAPAIRLPTTLRRTMLRTTATLRLTTAPAMGRATTKPIALTDLLQTARMDTIHIPPTAALPMDIGARSISTTEFLWASARGSGGDGALAS
jgi:hypothetical protein